MTPFNPETEYALMKRQFSATKAALYAMAGAIVALALGSLGAGAGLLVIWLVR